MLAVLASNLTETASRQDQVAVQRKEEAVGDVADTQDLA